MKIFFKDLVRVYLGIIGRSKLLNFVHDVGFRTIDND